MKIELNKQLQETFDAKFQSIEVQEAQEDWQAGVQAEFGNLFKSGDVVVDAKLVEPAAAFCPVSLNQNQNALGKDYFTIAFLEALNAYVLKQQ